ncbi:hypothetical protein C0993_007079 [Termitomyces sp. T159_Od127]|nr:hypothetical protein C0993_007079 [Termitomyces sp. T159_Od127]
MSTKIEGKLDDSYALQHHDLKEVKKAAKKAKAFETQKLVKKLKGFRKKSGTSEETIEAERQLDLLKELDHELVATTALKTKLIKNRILNGNENVQAAISKELVTNMAPAIPGSDAAKVQSRLLSSKILASGIASVVSGLECIIQPPDISGESAAGDKAAFQRPRKLRKVDHVSEAVFDNSTPLGDVEGGQALEGVLDVDNVGWESGTVDEEETEGETGWESGSAAGNRDNESFNDSDDDEELSIHPPPRKTPKLPLTQVPKRPTGMQSTFLPSLSVGFTRGESDDSDLSESEVKVADIDIKKNRRGQRARRAIWEKKFGKNANHKKKEAEVLGLDRNGSEYSLQSVSTLLIIILNLKGYTRLAADNKTAPHTLRKTTARWGQHTASAPISAPKKTTMVRNSMKPHMEEKPMHPSWEAKRKLKEKERVGIVPSQGRKIKF